MERNFKETLGAGATVQLEAGSRNRFDTSIPARNMHRLEELAYTIKPPVWPEAVLGPIDPTLARTGAAIYQQRRAACHKYSAEITFRLASCPFVDFRRARLASILLPCCASRVLFRTLAT